MSNSSLDELYMEIFEAEEAGNQEKAERLRKKARKYINGEISVLDLNTVTEEELKELDEKDKTKYEFFYRTRKKAFHKNLREQFEADEVDDIDLALGINSMLTHMLIEMKKEGSDVYHKLDMEKLTEHVYRFLKGDLSTEDLMESLNEDYGEYLFSKVKKEDSEDE